MRQAPSESSLPKTMFRGQQEFRFESAPTSAPENSATSSEAVTSIKQIDESAAEALSSNAVVPQLLENEMQPQQDQQQHQHQQKPLQELLQDQETRIQQMLHEQENRLKEEFTTQICALTATIKILLQKEVSMVDVGTQCSEPEEAGGQGPADASSPAQQPRHHESFLYADDIVPDVPTAKHACQTQRGSSIRSAVGDKASPPEGLTSSLSTAATLSLSAPPAGHGASKPPSAPLPRQAPQSSTWAEDGGSMTLLSSSQSRKAPSQTKASTDAFPSLVQSCAKPFQSVAPIPIPGRSGAHSSTSLEGSSPKISAFLLGLSANDVMSSSGADTDSDNEEGALPRSHGRLDTSSDESGSEGSVRRWVSSLGSSVGKASPGSLSRAKPASALRPRARAAGGELAAARARTPAAALTALRSTSGGSVSTVCPAAALSTVATAASLSASRPTSTATAAPNAVALSASLAAAAPAAAPTAFALAAALSAMAPAASPSALPSASTSAPSAVRPTAMNAPNPAQSESAQAHQADAVQPADAAEADADAAEIGVAQAAETDAAEPASALTTETVHLAASDAATHLVPHQITDGSVQRFTGHEPGADHSDSASASSEEGLASGCLMTLGRESTQPNAAATAAAHQLADLQDAAPKAEFPSGSLLAFGRESIQPTAAADQPADVQTVAASEPQRSLSSKWVQDSYWHYEEDLDADSDFFSAAGPWAEAPATSLAAPGVEPVTAAAAQEAAAPMTEDTVGSELVSAAAEGALQLGSLIFGSITPADLLGVGHKQCDSMGTAGCASSVVPATAPATAATGLAAVGSTAVDAVAASVVPVDTAVACEDTAVGPSLDSCIAQAEVTDESPSVSELSSSLTDAQVAVSNDASATLDEEVASFDEEEEREHQHAGLSGHGVEDRYRREEYLEEEEKHDDITDKSLEYTAFLTDSLLVRMEQQAGNDGGKIKALGVEDNMDLMQMGGHDNQAIYNIAVMEGVNEQLAAAKHKMQPPAPVLKQLTPLRRPPKTPRAVACAVHANILGAVHLAEAPMPEGVKHSCLLFEDAGEFLKSVDEGIARTEADLKMAIADSIFDDIIGDTAAAFLDAHGLQEPSEPPLSSNSN